MAAAHTFGDEKRARLRELHAAGMSLRQIATELSASTETISRHARNMGLSFDRSQTAEATKARVADLAAGRAALAERMLDEANLILDDMHGEYRVFNFGGKDNTFASEVLDEPPIEAKRSMMTTAAIAFDKVSRVVERESDGGAAEGVSMILKLMGQIGVDDTVPDEDEPGSEPVDNTAG